jgi:ABC-type glycerol-3-phosphate transport system substrate-binding protein
MRRYAVLLVACLLALLTGCGLARRSSQARGTTRVLTPTEYQLLPDAEQVRYKNVLLRIPNTWGGVLLPFDSGPYSSPIEKTVHSGDLGTLIGLYDQSLFELEHPRVKIEYINFDMWSDNFQSALAVALSAHRAPAYYIARDLPQTIEQGMYADLTPLMQKWDQFHQQPESEIREGTVNGHIYTLAGNELSALVIRYRKDWFREAGIFNEYGEPGPPTHWTWEQFRQIAQKLTDPKRGRYGFSGMLGDFLYNDAHDLDLIIPDPTGRHTWIFNDRDPVLLRSLQMARDMVQKDKSVLTSVSTDWFQWHSEFDAGHTAMVVSWAAHLPSECLQTPLKLGKDKPFAQTVGMAPPPHSDSELSALHPATNPIGFDPTLTPEQLEAAFEWCKSWFYGDSFVNRMRDAAIQARVEGHPSTLYASLLTLPYKPQANLLDIPFEKVFPPDYLRCYRQIRAAHTPPLPREFGLSEPPTNEFNQAVHAMYSEAITGQGDLKELLARSAHLINTTLLAYRGKDDRVRLHQYIAARSDFYRRYYPHYYATQWQEKQRTYFNVP